MATETIKITTGIVSMNHTQNDRFWSINEGTD